MRQSTFAADTCPHLGLNSVTFHRFCQALQNSTLDPLYFIDALSQTPSRCFQPFAYVLIEIAERVAIEAKGNFLYALTVLGDWQSRIIVQGFKGVKPVSARSFCRQTQLCEPLSFHFSKNVCLKIFYYYGFRLNNT